MQREEHRRLFGDSSTKTFELTVLQETYDAAVQIAHENNWSQDYANLVIFANGLSFLQGKAALGKASTGQIPLDETVNRLGQDLQKYMAMYSVMKYQAFLKTNDNEAMDMALNALRREKELAKRRMAIFRQDEERLKGEIGALREQNAALRKRVEEIASPELGEPQPSGTTSAQVRKGWVSRIRRLGRKLK